MRLLVLLKRKKLKVKFHLTQGLYFGSTLYGKHQRERATL